MFDRPLTPEDMARVEEFASGFEDFVFERDKNNTKTIR
jgi:hypothetical protein